MYIQTLTFLACDAGFVGDAVLRAGGGVFGLAIQHYRAKQVSSPRLKATLSARWTCKRTYPRNTKGKANKPKANIGIAKSNTPFHRLLFLL